MTQVRKVLPPQRESRVLVLLPEYDKVGNKSTSGHAITPVGAPVSHGGHYDMGDDDGISLDKAVLPVNESVSGFTMTIATQLTGTDDNRNILELRNVAETHLPAYIQIDGSDGGGIVFGVVYNQYTDNPDRSQEFLVIPTITGSHVLSLRVDRTQVFGSRLSAFVDGVKQSGPNSTSGVDVDAGMFSVPPDAIVSLGSDGASPAEKYLGAILTDRVALSDGDIAEDAAWIKRNHAVVH